MGITDKTRKLLWGRAGGRCAFCQRDLSVGPTHSDDDAVVGEECHIYSSEPNGPRYTSPPPFPDMDCHQNLMLLCRVHHKQVDDQPIAFTSDVLLKMKLSHELNVSRKLEPQLNDARSSNLTRTVSGTELADCISGSQMYDFDHDELQDESEVKMVGSFLQELHDWLTNSLTRSRLT